MTRFYKNTFFIIVFFFRAAYFEVRSATLHNFQYIVV